MWPLCRTPHDQNWPDPGLHTHTLPTCPGSCREVSTAATICNQWATKYGHHWHEHVFPIVLSTRTTGKGEDELISAHRYPHCYSHTIHRCLALKGSMLAQTGNCKDEIISKTKTKKVLLAETGNCEDEIISGKKKKKERETERVGVGRNG